MDGGIPLAKPTCERHQSNFLARLSEAAIDTKPLIAGLPDTTAPFDGHRRCYGHRRYRALSDGLTGRCYLTDKAGAAVRPLEVRSESPGVRDIAGPTRLVVTST